MKLSLVIAFLVILSCAKATDPFADEDYEAGLLELQPGDEMFYWLIRSRSSPSKDPLVIWLSGGPGCSSEVALFYENGPWTVNDDLTLEKNDYSWNEVSNLLYVDQPLGTGYSSTTNPDHYATNEEILSETFYNFFVKFLEKFPEYKGRELFITGESYAGHMIPSISSYFISRNNSDINLISVAIGNGWVKPVLQYPAYRAYAYENNLLSEFDNVLLGAGFWICQKLINFGFRSLAYKECQAMLLYSTGGMNMTKFNFYDIREKCEHPPLCYDMSPAGRLLDLPEIKKLLGVSNQTWQSCRFDVQAYMLGDWTLDSSVQVRDTLENGVGVFVYNGDKDYVCNWRGSEDWTNEVFWENQNTFKTAPYQKWTVDGEPAGEYKKVKNFTFLRVYDAGHMAPMDQPRNTLVMLKLFMNRAF